MTADKPVRILFINRMASMVRGGGETFDLEMARHLADLGCDVTFLTGIPLFGKAVLGPDDWWDENSSISNITIRSPYLGWLPWDKMPGGWHLRIFDFKCFEKAAADWAFKHREEFDIIQACELPFLVHQLKSKIENRKSKIPPVVVRLTAPDFYDPVGGIPAADAAIASGDTMKKIRASVRPDCHDIPNGVDVGNFGFWNADFGLKKKASDLFRKTNAIPEDAIVVCHIARFQAVKNHPMLINAFAQVIKQVPNAYLVLAGSGPMRSQTEAKVKSLELSDHVVFLGETKHSDLPAVYAASDINVMPSDYESFCFAVLEGMASCLPHAVTETNWIPMLIGASLHSKIQNPKSKIKQVPGGLVTPIGDATAFADALVTLAQNPAQRAAMGAWNRERVVKDFTWDASARKLLDVYVALVDNQK